MINNKYGKVSGEGFLTPFHCICFQRSNLKYEVKLKKGKSVVKDIIALIKVILYNVNKFKRPWRCGPHGVVVIGGPRT